MVMLAVGKMHTFELMINTSAPRQTNAPRTPRKSKWVFSSLALVRRRVLLSLRGQVWPAAERTATPVGAVLGRRTAADVIESEA